MEESYFWRCVGGGLPPRKDRSLCGLGFLWYAVDVRGVIGVPILDARLAQRLGGDEIRALHEVDLQPPCLVRRMGHVRR